MTRRMRRTVVVMATLMAMASSVLGAAPAHAAVEYLASSGWNTFAAWQAPSGNIYTAQYRASVARDTNTKKFAWRLNTRCMVNGTPATCSRHANMGLAVYDQDPNSLRFPWNLAPRDVENYQGDLPWQGDWHSSPLLPAQWLLTDGYIWVHWTAPNKDSSTHWVCSNDLELDDITVERPRSSC
jgi:hypothetical protein